jgi:hypothetical protein
MNKSLYMQLGHLVETMPDLSATTLPPEALPWVARAQALVFAVQGDTADVDELKKASEKLDSIVSRWKAAQQIAAIVHRTLVMAEPGLRRWALPEWIDRLEDKVLFALLVELYGAFNSEYRVLAAIGVRTAFDRATESLGIDPSLSFSPKLNKAESTGHVSTNEKKALAVLVDAGSAAAHRAWRPTQDDLTAMLDALESFLKRVFLTNPKLEAIKGTVPPRP